MPKVSVIIPAFNCSATITRAIDSVVAQTISDLEIIVVNDGSTDDTLDKLKKYGDRIMVYDQPNQGVAEARNKGVSIGTGEFIAFLDADDEWYPNKLEVQLDLFEKYPETGLVSAAAKYVDENGNVLGEGSVSYSGNIVEKVLRTNPIVTSSVLVKRDNLLQITPLFCKAFQPFEDWQLWIRFAARFNIIVSPEIMVRYYIIPVGLSMSHSVEYFRSLIQLIYEKLLAEDNLNHLIRSNWRSLHANIHVQIAKIAFERGETFKARWEVFKALMISPLHLKWDTAITILLLPNSWRNKLKDMMKKRFMSRSI
jgi:glycosyltransferase involved in cell wall biosynthesis